MHSVDVGGMGWVWCVPIKVEEGRRKLTAERLTRLLVLISSI